MPVIPRVIGIVPSFVRAAFHYALFSKHSRRDARHIGRLDGAGILSSWTETLNAMAASELVMDSADATLAGQLNWEHRDPFDRMIVAQATRRGLAIATSDRVIGKGAMTPVIVTG